MSVHSSQDQDSFRSLLVKGTRLLRQGKAGKALPFLEQAHAMEPENFDAALNLGGALVMHGHFSKAISVLESLRGREPENAMVWTNLGAAYLGNPVLATDDAQDRAIEAFKQALALDPTAPSVAYNLGLIYRDRQEREEAIKWFRKAVDTNPADRHARAVLKRLRADG